MIDLKDLRNDPQRYRDGAAAKAMHVDIDRLLALDEQLRRLLTERESIAAEKNQIGKQMGQLAGQMKKASPDDKPAIEQQMAELREKPNTLKQREQALASEIAEIEPQRDALWLTVPQPPDTDVPRGASADENVPIRTWAPDHFDPAKPFAEQLGFAPKSHVELMRQHDMVDFDRGVKMAGSRSYVLKGAGMQLHQAVLHYAMDFMVRSNGFTPISVPVLVRDALMVGTGFFPHGRDQAYAIANPTTAAEDGGLSLTGTGEVGLMGYHMDEILDEAALPLRYVTVSTCFRREAGAAGKDTAGLYRIHQFDKVEQVVICKADEAESRQWHQKMIGYVEALMQSLALPYRLLQCCTGDLGPKNADMIDIEAWMPSRGETDDASQPTGAYSETHSASRLYDYQCRRLNIRYKDSEAKANIICHSLNNTVAASPRILIPIVEMYQNEDGSITVPEALRSYMGGQEKID